MHQKWPKDLNEAVACVLGIEVYLTLKPHTHKKISSIQQPSEDKDSLKIVSAVQSTQNTILQMLSALTTQVDKIEAINLAGGGVGVNYKREAL